jgi:hypothetical protein
LRTAQGSTGNDYRSNAHELTAIWVPSGNTSVNARLVYLEQYFSLAPQFDYSGPSGNVMVNWRITGKLSVTGGWQRDLSSYQTAGTTHTRTDAISAASTWRVGTRTSLVLQYKNALRDDQGSPNGIAATRQDRLQDVSLRFNWQLRPLTTLSAAVTQSTRNTNQVNADFLSRQLSLSALLLF